jgi:glutathione S-transferase
MTSAVPVLFIGNKNYSSWSLRAWLALTKAGVQFEERLIVLDQPHTDAEIRAVSPAGRVPVLRVGDSVIWDSLAIMEWAGERAPNLWPADPLTRAVARSAVAEMHAGFGALRQAFPMSIKRMAVPRRTPAPDAALADVARIEAMWAELRGRFGAGGPWLFGTWSLADAAFAPVATRFESYAIPLSPAARAYVDTTLADADFQGWAAAGRVETWIEGDVDLV